ncbi:hypothetical protein VSR72_11985 [Paraburkholderia sp. JHI869]
MTITFLEERLYLSMRAREYGPLMHAGCKAVRTMLDAPAQISIGPGFRVSLPGLTRQEPRTGA